MRTNCAGRGLMTMRAVKGLLGAVLVCGMGGASVLAQGASTSEEKASAVSVQTFYLANVSQANDASDLVNALRNMLDPKDKIYLVQSQNAIAVRGTPDQQALAQKLLKELDRPKKTYRLTYTIAEADAGKRVGVQHFSMVVVAGQRTVMKQGSKVPVATGSFNAGNSETQMTYIDVGMNFDATLDEFASGVRLKTKVEQSSIAEEKSGVGAQDPIVRQSVLEGTSFLTPGKPLMLGSVDVPGSTRHLDVEVVMEQVMQ